MLIRFEEDQNRERNWYCRSAIESSKEPAARLPYRAAKQRELLFSRDSAR
jgi:hypothetical protein